MNPLIPHLDHADLIAACILTKPHLAAAIHEVVLKLLPFGEAFKPGTGPADTLSIIGMEGYAPPEEILRDSPQANQAVTSGAGGSSVGGSTGATVSPVGSAEAGSATTATVGDYTITAGNAGGGGQPGWILKCKGWETDPNAYIYFTIQGHAWAPICKALGREEWIDDRLTACRSNTCSNSRSEPGRSSGRCTLIALRSVRSASR